MMNYDDQKFVIELPALISKNGDIEIDFAKEDEAEDDGFLLDVNEI